MRGDGGLAHIPATIDRDCLPRHVVVHRQHHSHRCDIVHRAKMPHRDKIRVRVGVAGHHIRLNQHRSEFDWACPSRAIAAALAHRSASHIGPCEGRSILAKDLCNNFVTPWFEQVRGFLGGNASRGGPTLRAPSMTAGTRRSPLALARHLGYNPHAGVPVRHRQLR